LGGSISGITKVVGAFCLVDGADEACNIVVHGVDGARLGHAQPVLDLGEHLLDWIEVWRVGRQEGKLGAEGAISYRSAIALQLSPDATASATRSLKSFE